MGASPSSKATVAVDAAAAPPAAASGEDGKSAAAATAPPTREASPAAEPLTLHGISGESGTQFIAHCARLAAVEVRLHQLSPQSADLQSHDARSLSPTGEFPVLTSGELRAVGVHSCLLLLDALAPGALLPAAGGDDLAARLAVLQQLHELAEVDMLMVQTVLPEVPANEVGAFLMSKVGNVRRACLKDHAQSSEQHAAIHAELHKCLLQWERGLQNSGHGFISGAEFGAPDALLFWVLAAARVHGFQVAPFPTLASWHARVYQRPEVQALWAELTQRPPERDPARPERRKSIDALGATFATPFARALEALGRLLSQAALSAEDRSTASGIMHVLCDRQNLSADIDHELTQTEGELDDATLTWLRNIEGRSLSKSKMTRTSAHYTFVPTPSLLQPEETKLLEEVSQDLGVWELDVLELHERTGRRSLFFLGLATMQRFNIIARVSALLPAAKRPQLEAKLCDFFHRVEEKYWSQNPYHNSAHGADVLNSTVHLLVTGEAQAHLSHLYIFAGVLAAAVHDVDHMGVNNKFLKDTHSELAIRYSDSSVLERHHLATAFTIMQEPQSKIFDGFPEDEYRIARKAMIASVLSTDLANHMSFVSAINNHVAAGDLQALFEDKMQIVCLVLKVADLGHSCKPLELHRRWSALITEEFYQQGDKERELGLPISPFMDRTSPSAYASQCGFMRFIVAPIVKAAAQVLPGITHITEHAVTNAQYWQDGQDAGKTEL